MKRKTQGLTLIEIAVALAVLAVLASIAVPSLNSLLARKRLVSTAEQLGADLGEARFLAAQNGTPVFVVFHGGSNWCYAVSSSSDCGCIGTQACQLRVVHAADVPGVELGAASDAFFDPAAAGAGAGSATWHSRVAAHELRVSVQTLGRAHICTPTGLTGYADC
jgi:prepilin-type N-terminal cleavage/methylation domain-containing protein